MHKCPHCNQPGVGRLKKFFAGRKMPATCKVCGKKSYQDIKKGFIALIPFIICWITTKSIEDEKLFLMVFFSGIAITVYLQEFWVPLIKMERE